MDLTPAPLSGDVQKSSVGELVQLFDLDLSSIQGGTFYFTPSCFETSAIVWRGNTYTPIDVEAEGFEASSKGQLARPKFRVSNIAGLLQALVRENNDLLGCMVTRWRTLRKYLDGQEAADPDVHFVPDVYVIQRKVEQSPVALEWELSCLMDYEGKKVPARQILRDFCSYTYRRWVGDPSTGAFVYGECPYNGTACFDRGGDVVLEAHLDVCGKKLTDCRKRFGWSNFDTTSWGGTVALPTRAFPGVARNRIQ